MNLRLPYTFVTTGNGALTLSIYNPKTNSTLHAGATMSEADIIAYKGDSGYDLMFTITDIDGLPFNLTGSTVKFQTAALGSADLKTDGSCTLDPDPTTGFCSYTTAAVDFDTVGVFDVKLKITIGSKVHSIGGAYLKVLRGVPDNL